LILDAGSGPHPMGDINVDLDLNKKTENFVRAYTQYLPFKNDIFDFVRASHLIEHVSNPLKLINELYQVSRKEVQIICPQRFGSHSKRDDYAWFFNVHWFEKVMGLLRIASFRIRSSFYSLRPYEIHVQIKKS
jgi:ubiquinone/menaquinone biosynthesis C-methylase UbiE